MMHVSLVMTLLGPDRPGLVEAVAECVRRHEGNWLESRLARLSGHFAGILQLQIPAAQEEAFRASLAELEKAERLQCLVSASEPPAAGGRLVTLNCVGQDRPGIVYAITDALAEFGVNVESFDSAIASAPMSGEMLFEATLTVRLPEDLDLNGLEKRLSDIGDELMLDVTMG